MDTTLAIDPRAAPVMRAFTARLRADYGDRLAKAVLYGSRARGEAGADSDWDVAIFLRDMTDRWAENDRLADIAFDLIPAHGQVVHAMAFAPEEWDTRTLFMRRVRDEGLTL